MCVHVCVCVCVCVTLPTSLSEVLEAHLIHREVANSGSILGTHVRDGGSVSNG